MFSYSSQSYDFYLKFYYKYLHVNNSLTKQFGMMIILNFPFIHMPQLLTLIS